ncbi:LytTR family transcriptional regulator (plasmid) [Sphingomonas changnyeongensis]|uniref:LytTR family transcriptional regulator n=1 Tax=Sphingomonas changnyeongensis TaxID=2698679 RepID=A0A7Z2NYC8_9SPHN|nr:LytTR family transcriptional regulator [Sphingomonas changnyeongensis]
MQLKMPFTTLSTVVSIAPDAADTPLAVDIDAMASAEVRWNGSLIGRNGIPGADRSSEVAGLYTASIPIPPRLVRPGDNHVTIILSAHHLWFSVRQPIHRLVIGPPRDAEAYTLRHYLPTVATLVVPACALLLLGALLFLGQIGRTVLPVMTILALIVVQGLIEISKIAVPYTYPEHLARLTVLTGLTAVVGLLLVVLTCRVFLPLWTWAVSGGAAVAMAVACLLSPGLDRQAVAVFVVALLAVAAGAAPGTMRRDPRAGTLLIAAVSLAIWAYRTGPDFLDTVYYVTAAGAAIALGLAALLRPAKTNDAPVAVTEPSITLRDGARHHIMLPSQITFLKAEDDYCTLYLADGREIMVTMTLKAALALMPAGFIRIHRSYAINVRHLSGTQPGPGGRVAKLHSGTTLPIGRSYAADLRVLVIG